ncbi:MAG: DUF4118 domain-containing protein [Rhizobiales bacterium]|nr:DUF4118 domain-containing protein [Hyphomicrobiales bacterium]
MLDQMRDRSELHRIGMALVLVAAMTVTMILVNQYVRPTNRSVVYLIPVIAAAVWWGVLPAVMAALAGIVAAVFFFYPPVYSFKVPQSPQLVNLALFLVVALVTGRLATAVRAQAEVARKREKEVRELYAFSRRLGTARAASDIYAAIQEHLSNLIQRKAVLFEADSAKPVDTGGRNDQWVPEQIHAEISRYAGGDGTSESGSVIDGGGGHLWLVRHVAPKTPAFGAIAIDLGGAADSGIDDVRGRIDEVLADAAATLDRLDIARVIDDARMRSETEVLREALIGSVSHELRTPLASILGSATVLCNTPTVAEDERLGALANVIRDEAERLNSDIQNLLDATRITSQSLKPLQQWVECADLINSALERRDRRLAGHVVTTDVASDLPLIYVDPVLMEQALVQILDNAAKYSTPGSTISVTARREGDEIVLSVADRGTGFTREEHDHLGERFFRGQRHLTTIPGSGLGLWIANAFVTASNGELEVTSSGTNQGSIVSVRLPVVREAILQLERAGDE